MDKNKFILPSAILVACLILGGAYYASEVNKSASIERQQANTLLQQQQQIDADQRQVSLVKSEKSACVFEAQNEAIKLYEASFTCTSSYAPANCFDGTTYLVVNYDTQYATCLQRAGLN